MKIITILILMISTQVLAEESVIVGKQRDYVDTGTYTVKQCNQIANVSKRTIKAAISGVPIAEVINKFTVDVGTKVNSIVNPHLEVTGISSGRPDTGVSDKNVIDPLGDGNWNNWSNNWPIGVDKIRAIYKTVDQIKTKHGQVRPQDRVLLNNRVELKLIKCRKMAFGDNPDDLC